MATLTKKDRCFIFDIIFNQEDDFDATTLAEYIFEYYGLVFSLDDIQSVIDEFFTDEVVELERCEQTIDLFEVA